MTTALDLWMEDFVTLHGTSRISVPERPWAGRIDWHRSGSYSVAMCAGGEPLMRRENRHIRVDPRGAYELVVLLSGQASIERDRSTTQLRPGQMLLCDTDRPFTFTHDARYRSVAFIMPAAKVGHGPRLLDAGRGLGRIVHQMAVTLQNESGAMTPAAFQRTCASLLELVDVVADGESASAPAGQRATVEAQIRAYVRQHATDPALSVSAIAKALAWSPRYLQQVLHAAGTTPRELIRLERLRLARQRLSSPQWAASSIGQIARASGFASQAKFATAFRQEFAMTPTDARQRG